MKIRVVPYPLLAISAMLLSGLTLLAENSDSAKITELLRQAKEHAVNANLNAEQIEVYTRSHAGWETHARQLNIMTTNVNDLGKDVAKLTAAREEGSPWQQESINNINPLLRSMAGNLSATIKHLNANKDRVHLQMYQDYAMMNSKLSQQMLTTINDYLHYAEAKANAASLEQKLQLSPQSRPDEQ